MNAEERIIKAAGITVNGSGEISWDTTSQAGQIFGKLVWLRGQFPKPGSEEMYEMYEEIERLLDQLYGLVGARDEYTGYAYWAGRHPIQKYIARMMER